MVPADPPPDRLSPPQAAGLPPALLEGITEAARCRLRELLLRCALGDQEAFAEYYRTTSPVLHAWAQACHQERQAAEDVLVDVYVTIWRRAGTIDPTGADPLWEWTLDIFDRVLRSRGATRADD